MGKLLLMFYNCWNSASVVIKFFSFSMSVPSQEKGGGLWNIITHYDMNQTLNFGTFPTFGMSGER